MAHVPGPMATASLSLLLCPSTSVPSAPREDRQQPAAPLTTKPFQLTFTLNVSHRPNEPVPVNEEETPPTQALVQLAKPRGPERLSRAFCRCLC